MAGTPFTESDLESAIDLAETKRKEADRLEAAWKRDTAQFRREIEHLKDERNKAPVHERERLRKNGFVIVPQERLLTKPAENVNSGDAAKLREAVDYLCERMADMDATFDPSEVECLRAALSAPPRNCDRPECATTKAAQDVWRREDGGKTAYYEWLFAPAAEQKGESNEQK